MLRQNHCLRRESVSERRSHDAGLEKLHQRLTTLNLNLKEAAQRKVREETSKGQAERDLSDIATWTRALKENNHQMSLLLPDLKSRRKLREITHLQLCTRKTALEVRMSELERRSSQCTGVRLMRTLSTGKETCQQLYYRRLISGV